MEPDAKRAFYLGRYNCIERLGVGPLGETFRAKIYGVAGFEKQFAVKRLHARLCVDEPFVARFVNAATAYSGLDHERIARVHEVNVQGAQYYLVVDLVRGLDLEHLLATLRGRGEAMTTDSAMLLALDLCEALDHAHARKDLLPGGVAHLGLAPRTVMLTYEGEIKLLDVGLLAALIKPGWADDDSLVPTLGYLAPEALRGGPVDTRSDVFSLGALLHELISGARAFDGASAAEVRQKIESAPPAPPAADGRLQALLPKAMAVDPEQRFPSVAALREALTPILGSRATRARNELAALVRRLGRPASRTGSFAAVVIPPAPSAPASAPTLTAAAPWSPPVTRPPPIPPPIPPPPPGAIVRPGRLETLPPKNTFAGVGPAHHELAPVEVTPLLGATTAPTMPVVPSLPPLPPLIEDEATTTPVERIDPDSLPGIPDAPPARSLEGEARLEAEPAGHDELPPLAAQAAEALQPSGSLFSSGVAPAAPSPANGSERRADPTRELPLLIPEGPAESTLPPPARETAPPSLFVPPPLAAAAPSRVPRWLTIGLTVVGLAGIALAILHFRESGSATPTETTPPPQEKATPPQEKATPPQEKATPPREKTPPPQEKAVVAPEKATPTPEKATPTPEKATPTPEKATPTPEKTTPTGSGLAITTTPPGATIYVDGEPRGASPLEVALAPGAHKLVALADGFKVHHETVRGGAPAKLTLELEHAALPAGVAGPAGLKVRCKSALRILVDGADSGRMCPNDERISVAPGPHKIGLYSPTTDETHELDATVKDGEHSTRVYTKY